MIDIRAAIAAVLTREPDALVVSTCGYITRDLYNLVDRPEHFYLVGSMGMAAPVGLGVALGRPDRRVVVLDGDGSFAMNPGCLTMLAENAPDLLHVVLDNGAHESTGGQRTVALGDPVAMALAAGYPAAQEVDDLTDLETVGPGLSLVHVRCAPRSYPAGGRVEPTPQELVDRFRTTVASGTTTALDLSTRPIGESR